MGVYLVLCSKLLHKHVTLYNIIWWFKYGPYLITFGFEAPKKTPPPSIYTQERKMYKKGTEKRLSTPM